MIRLRALARSSLNDDYRCLFCLHVRTATVLFGLWQLLLHLFAVILITTFVLHPNAIFSNNTDVSNDTTNALPQTLKHPFYETGYIGDGLNWEIKPHHKLTVENQCFVLLLTMISLAMTLLLIYGTLKNRPQYLMPFFCLQVFDLCLSCLTVVGYFSSAVNLRKLIQEQVFATIHRLFYIGLCSYPHVNNTPSKPDSEVKRMILNLDENYIAFCAILFICLALMLKCNLDYSLIMLSFEGVLYLPAYFIGVVWSCYKYLLETTHRSIFDLVGGGVASQVSREGGGGAGGGSDHEDTADSDCVEGQTLLPPPKYTDAIKTRACDDRQARSTFAGAAGPSALFVDLPPPYACESGESH